MKNNNRLELIKQIALQRGFNTEAQSFTGETIAPTPVDVSEEYSIIASQNSDSYILPDED